MPRFTPEKFLDFVENYKKENLNQKAGLLEYAQKVQALDPDLLSDEANWVRTYRQKMDNSIVMKVPYFSQRDNYTNPDGTCFSSSCAMLLEYMKPGTLPGSRGDDKYLKRVLSYGQSIYPAVQVQALSSFGLKTKFVSEGTFDQLNSQLDRSIPVPAGILHKGPASAPSGFGHWIIVIGREKDPKAPGGEWYIVHDPWGELNHSNGTYISQDGKSLKYSKNLMKSRWTIYGDGSGYAIITQ